ncbi:MAG: ATP-binding protein [Pseudomonadota bacterium]
MPKLVRSGTERSALEKYATATAAVTAAGGACWLAGGAVDPGPFTPLLLCAVVYAAWSGGLGPGLAASALAALVFVYVIVPPRDSFSVSPSTVPAVMLFAVAALFVVGLGAAQRRTAEALRQARDRLQAAVGELEIANRALQDENAERRMAEARTREAQDELQTTIDTIPVLIATYHPDGTRDFVNKSWQDYTGIPLERARGRDWAIALHGDDFDEGQRLWHASLASARPAVMEQRFRRADGAYRWHLVHRVPQHNDRGEVVRWYSIGYDIEDRKHAEDRLRRSEAYLAEAQKLSRTGSFAWTPADGTMVLSEEARRILQLDPAERPTLEAVLQRVHPEDLPLVRRQIDRALSNDHVYDHENRALMADGTVKHVHVRAHRVTYASGDSEIVGALIDVTATRAADEALQAAQAQLAHAGRIAVLGEMSASIAHEVNQPLAAVITNAEASRRWLDRSVPEIGRALRAIDAAVAAADHAARVIQNIRALARKAAPALSPLDLNGVVEEALALVQREALNRRVPLQRLLDEELPAVRADRTQLQQVVVNLVLNALQATAAQADDDRTAVIVRTERLGGEHVRIAVEDAGIGVPPEELERLFTPFHTTRPDGMGMGLSISRSIVEAHGGELSAMRNAGPGMTFAFTLPMDQAAAAS